MEDGIRITDGGQEGREGGDKDEDDDEKYLVGEWVLGSLTLFNEP